MKKYLISFLCVMIVYLTSFTNYNKAHALGLDAPGYVDETLEAVFTAIAVTVAGAAHAKENFEDNVRVVYESVKTAYNTWAPAYKEEFLNGILAIDGEMTIAGNYIENLLTDYIASHITDSGFGPEASKFDDVDSWDSVLLPKGYSITISFNGETRTFSNTDGAFKTTVSINERNGHINFPYTRGSAGGNLMNVKLTDLQLQNINNATSVKGIQGFINLTNAIGATFTFNDLTSNTVVSLENPPTDLGIKEFYDRSSTSGLTLGVPQNVPYAENGVPLTLGVDGLYLPDGTLYDGPINWQLQGNLTDAGALVLPDIMVNGVPHVIVNTPTGSILVNKETGLPLGQADVAPGDITATAPELTFIDGVPYFKTTDGTLINVLTGEIVGTVPGELPTESTGLWSKLWEFLMSILDVLKKILTAIIELPIKLLDLLKALLLALFVPSANWWEDNINGLKDIIWSDKMGDMVDGFSDLANGGGGKFESIVVSLMGVSDLKIIDATAINSILENIHSWVRGVVYPFLLLFNINSLYKLIRGTSLVEATRGLANRSKGGD